MNRPAPAARWQVGKAISLSANSWLGLIAPTGAQLPAVAGSALIRLTLAASWASLEPSQGTFSPIAASALKAQLAQYVNTGRQVILDLGLQYPPSWVFGLPGATRFVDQYGDVWHGVLGADVPNAVFNPAVRAAEAGYLQHLASIIPSGSIVAIRVGGLVNNELSYPAGRYAGHTNLLWDYDPVAQAGAPVPNWRPGTGTVTDASESAQYYFDSLTRYQIWLMNNVKLYFGGIEQQILFPSWGLRPGMLTPALQNLLDGNSVAEVNGLISAGLDWASQVKAIAANNIPGVVYTTWLDAPSQGSTVAQEPPAAYLASLASGYRLPTAGENTGGGGTTALQLSLSRVQQYGMQGMMYMSGNLITTGAAGLRMTDLITAASNATS